MLAVFRLCFGSIVTVKTIQLAGIVILNPEGRLAVWEIILSLMIFVIMLVASGAFLFGKFVRISAGTVLLGFIGLWLTTDLFSNHTYLILIICLIFALNIRVTLLLKVQLSIVYFYAALTKINETYIAGNELYVSMVQRSIWQWSIGVDPPATLLIALSIFSILAEAFLAFGLWFKKTRWIALVVGAFFHISLVVGVTGGVSQFVNLIIYGSLLLCLYLPFFHGELDGVVHSRRSRKEAEIAS